MKIDRSKAPEGATHWSAGDGDRYEAYWKPNSGGYDCYCPEWRDPAWQGINDELPDYALPIYPEWNGEGLPPVGTVCEFMTYIGGYAAWAECRVIAHDNAMAIINYKGNYSGHPHTKFRPIRTPEQIAAEAEQAAIKVIEDRILARMGDLNVRNLAEDLHELLQEMAVKP